MISTTASEPVFVEARGLDVMFRLKVNAPTSLRSGFVDLLQSPVQSLLRKSDYLHALNDIRFAAKPGDRIALLGRNGAGKSTLCRCLAGIFPHAKDKIRMSGSVRAILEPSLVLHPDLTGRENAMLLADLTYPHKTRRERKELLEEALAFSGLGGFLDTPYRFYSNGMQSRLCLSVATSQPADIFILDEVFEAADQAFRAAVSRRILHLIDRSGIVFFVSHSQEQVRRVCRKALLLDQGKMLFFGDLEEGLDRYNRVLHETSEPSHIG